MSSVKREKQNTLKKLDRRYFTLIPILIEDGKKLLTHWNLCCFYAKLVNLWYDSPKNVSIKDPIVDLQEGGILYVYKYEVRPRRIECLQIMNYKCKKNDSYRYICSKIQNTFADYAHIHFTHPSLQYSIQIHP